MMISEDKGNALTNFTAKQVLDTLDLIEKLHGNTPDGIITDSECFICSRTPHLRNIWHDALQRPLNETNVRCKGGYSQCLT